uniref:Heme-binding protein 2 n=1 Tax=Oryzias sinensis TaxID=183150 RepID=A0A8C7X7R8_9TELE
SWSAEEMELQLLVLEANKVGLPKTHSQGAFRASQLLCLCVQDFEVRQYPPTDWLSTKVEGSDLAAFMEAPHRYWSFLGQPCPDAWPAIITVSKEGRDEKVTLSWFVPPETKLQTFDTSTTERSQTLMVTEVRHSSPSSSFGGHPDLNGAQDHVDILKKSVAKARKKLNSHTFTGAGYDVYLAPTHYNEVWVYAA